jgi:ketosteroid isomerase-like protein
MRKRIILEYINAINETEIDKLYSLMASNHLFIDSQDNKVSGKEAMRQSWIGYFKMFPDYQIEIVEIIEEDSSFALFGYASGTYKNKS